MTTEEYVLGSDISLIGDALALAESILRPYIGRDLRVERKHGGDPVTAADRQVDDALRAFLLRDGEGWLSEETVDDRSRLDRRRVWVVDPLDGTKEFIMGIPEWCVSIGLVIHGEAVAGGIANPATGESYIGAVGEGVLKNGVKAASSVREGRVPVVLASRSEVDRGEWAAFSRAPFEIRPMGSVAYKLARVAAGDDEATWTLAPKNEWDVAAGVALVNAAGGYVRAVGEPLVFNRANTLLEGLIACAASISETVEACVSAHAPTCARNP